MPISAKKVMHVITKARLKSEGEIFEEDDDKLLALTCKWNGERWVINKNPLTYAEFLLLRYLVDDDKLYEVEVLPAINKEIIFP